MEGKLSGMLVMYLKGAFDQVSRNCPLGTMKSMEADSDLIR